MDSIESTGETKEEAITKGLEKLGVGINDVIVEELEEASRGVFGLGARPARVRLQLIGKRPTPPPEETPPATVVYADEEPVEDDATVGKEVLSELLEKMSVQFEIEIRRAEPTRQGESAPWLLDVSGENMSALIGRRGETLDSLQYVTRLISSRRLQRRANIIVDVSGYKSRRSDRLRQLALRIAEQAIEQGRTVDLEPMPPYERRIIHMTLRNRPDVTTRSVGEGKTRKVTIVPK